MIMVQIHEIEQILQEFESSIEGVLATSIIYSPQALVLAEASQKLDRMVIQAMSEKILGLTKETLELLFKGDYKLKQVMIEEEKHMIILTPLTQEYHLVVVTTNEEAKGLVRMNLRALTNKITPYL